MAVLGSELPQKRVMRAVPVRVRAFRALVKINRGIVMNVDVVTGIIISMKMDLKIYNFILKLPISHHSKCRFRCLRFLCVANPRGASFQNRG